MTEKHIDRRNFLFKLGSYISASSLFLLNKGCEEQSSSLILKNPGDNRDNLAKILDCLDQIIYEYDSSNIVVGANAPATDVIGAKEVTQGMEYMVKVNYGKNASFPKDFIKLDKDVMNDPFATNKIVIGQEVNNDLTLLLRSNLESKYKTLPINACSIEGYSFGKRKGVVITAESDDLIKKVGCGIVGNTIRYGRELRAYQVWGYDDGSGLFKIYPQIK